MNGLPQVNINGSSRHALLEARMIAIEFLDRLANELEDEAIAIQG